MLNSWGVTIRFLLLPALLLLVSLCGSSFAAQEYGTISTRLVKIITSDDSGQPLGYPSRLAYDPVSQETYVLASNRRITVYNKDFFPLGSIGPGRGVVDVAGMAVSSEGKLYLARNIRGEFDVPVRAVVTIYNRALLVERQIFLDQIPGMTGFLALDLAVASDGTIFIVGNFTKGIDFVYKGALVLDSQGRFKRWMSPRGMVLRKPLQLAENDNTSLQESVGGEGGLAGNLPASLKPSGGDGRSDDEQVESDYELEMVDGVARLSSVVIDVNGRIYLLSDELSQVFVYDSLGTALFVFGQKGGAKGTMSTPRTLAVDYPRRLIYIADYMRHTILAYDYDSGDFVYEFGGKGRGPLWYLHPEHLAVDREGRVVIADLFNKRVQVVDPTNPERPVLEPIVPEGGAAAQVPLPGEQVSEVVSPLVESSQDMFEPLVGLEAPVFMASVPGPHLVPAHPVREIVPDGTKKEIVVAAWIEIPLPSSTPALVATEPILMPVPLTPPPIAEASSVLPKSRDGKTGVKGAVNALGAVVGVYGPVAAMLGVTTWLLRHKR